MRVTYFVATCLSSLSLSGCQGDGNVERSRQSIGVEAINISRELSSLSYKPPSSKVSGDVLSIIQPKGVYRDQNTSPEILFTVEEVPTSDKQAQNDRILGHMDGDKYTGKSSAVVLTGCLFHLATLFV